MGYHPLSSQCCGTDMVDKDLSIIVQCYLTTYDWIKSFLKITIEGRAIYGNLENKINTIYWPVENFTMQTIDKRAVTKQCRRKITEGQWAVLNFV